MVSETAEFYKNKNIFITGGTGFLGIAIIEKLLRSTPDVRAHFYLFIYAHFFLYGESFELIFFLKQVGQIYMLMREKRGKTIDQRLDEFKRNEV